MCREKLRNPSPKVYLSLADNYLKPSDNYLKVADNYL